MKKVVLTFGLLSGALSMTLMFGTMSFIDAIGFERGVFVGYTAIVISFLFVYFGIRSYRDNVNGGAITFSKGLGVGLLITLISCAFYVGSWLVIERFYFPDFVDQYNAFAMEQLKASGASAAEIDKAAAEAVEFKRQYANPFIKAAFTLLEPLPVGLLITFISAAVLRRKKP